MFFPLRLRSRRPDRRAQARQGRQGENTCHRSSDIAREFPSTRTPSSPPPTRPSTRNADLPPLHSLLQAAAVNTTTEAKVKVAINGFGRIGASRSLQSEHFSLRIPIASQDVSRNAIVPTAVVPSTPSDRRLVRRPVASRGSTVPHLDGSLRPVPSHGHLRSRP